MYIVYSPKCLEYSSPGHPESPGRIKLIYQELKKLKGYVFIEPEAIDGKDLLAVHDRKLIEAVKNNSFFDPDTPNIENIYYYARLSAGAALKAAYLVERQKNAFSLMRPPGHHASKKRPGGFCYFNNIAVACQYLLDKKNKVAILDLDVHHGNGTQDIFYRRENIIFCSLHQVPLYPGSGVTSGDNCYNYPLKAGTNYSQYLIYLKKAIDKIRQFQAHVLAVSLGFDSFIHDPLAQVNLQEKDYYEIGRRVSLIDLPTLIILEGGYSGEIGILARNFFSGFNN